MKMNKYFITSIVFIILFFPSCGNVEREEILRVKSSDSMVEVILIRTNAGATTAYGYMLYIVPPGAQPKEGQEIFKADNVEDLQVTWKEPKILGITYKKARIFFFTNFWQSKEVQNFNYVVTIDLEQHK
jgi:hypothetical protein